MGSNVLVDGVHVLAFVVRAVGFGSGHDGGVHVLGMAWGRGCLFGEGWGTNGVGWCQDARVFCCVMCRTTATDGARHV